MYEANLRGEHSKYGGSECIFLFLGTLSLAYYWVWSMPPLLDLTPDYGFEAVRGGTCHYSPAYSTVPETNYYLQHFTYSTALRLRRGLMLGLESGKKGLGQGWGPGEG